MKLNSLICKNVKRKPIKHKLSDGDGLYLEVHPSGRRYWFYRYSVQGRPISISLGAYPLVSLAEARIKRDEQKKLLRDGLDPSFVRHEKKRLKAFETEQTFELVAREWHKIKSPSWTEGYAADKLYRLEKDVFREIGRIPVSKLKAPDVVACMRKIEERSAYDMAKRALQTCSQIMRYAVQTGRIETSFLPHMKGALAQRKSTPFAAITPDEIPDFLKAMKSNQARLFRQTTLCIMLMMLTFVRTKELIAATWDEFDLEKREWIIPAERMKMRLTHVVPLCRQSIEILLELRSISGKRNHVFPHISKPEKHMSTNTILNALAIMGYKGRMTGHGFRALAMTTLKEKLGYRHEVIDRQLAHLPKSSVDRAYDRAQFLPERREMMQAWANYLDGLSNERPKETKWEFTMPIKHTYMNIGSYGAIAYV